MKYRIVTDKWLGFELQYKKWYYLFWVQMHKVGFTNTFASVEAAENWLKTKVIPELKEKNIKEKYVFKVIKEWRSNDKQIL